MPSRTRFNFFATLAASPNSPVAASIQSDRDQPLTGWPNPTGLSHRDRLTAANSAKVSAAARAATSSGFFGLGIVMHGPSWPSRWVQYQPGSARGRAQRAAASSGAGAGWVTAQPPGRWASHG